MQPLQHEYAKQVQHEERGPSFIMHAYAKKQATPQKSTSKRCRGTRSGVRTDTCPTYQSSVSGIYHADVVYPLIPKMKVEFSYNCLNYNSLF